MGDFPFFLRAVAKPILLGLTGLSVVAGLLAIASPQKFVRVATWGNRWIDTAGTLRIPPGSRWRALDRWVDLDRYALPYTRLLGVAACVAGVVLFYLGMTSM